MLHQIATLQFFIRRNMHGAASNQGNRTKFIQIAPIVRAYGHAYVRSCGKHIKIEKPRCWRRRYQSMTFWGHKIFRIISCTFLAFSRSFVDSSSFKIGTRGIEGIGKKTNRRTFISMTILICHLWFVTVAKRHQMIKNELGRRRIAITLTVVAIICVCTHRAPYRKL